MKTLELGEDSAKTYQKWGSWIGFQAKNQIQREIFCAESALLLQGGWVLFICAVGT